MHTNWIRWNEKGRSGEEKEVLEQGRKGEEKEVLEQFLEVVDRNSKM